MVYAWRYQKEITLSAPTPPSYDRKLKQWMAKYVSTGDVTAMTDGALVLLQSPPPLLCRDCK